MESRRMKSSERMSLTRSMDKPAPAKKQVDPEAKVEGFLIFGKAWLATMVMLGGIVLGTLVQTGSVDWIYSPATGTSPLLSCPSSADLFGSHSVLDGTSCELRFSFSSMAAFESSVTTAFVPYNAVASGDLQCFQKEPYGDCSTSSLCQVRCYSSASCYLSVGQGDCIANGFIWGSNYGSGAPETCSQTINLGGTNYPVVGASISAEPLCGPDLQLTPGMVMTLRGELIAVAVIGLLSLIAMFVKASVAPMVRTVVTSQKGLMIAKASANELRGVVESKWDAEFSEAQKETAALTHNGPKFETGSLAAARKSEPPTHPAKHFAASSWKYRVRVMHAMLKKRQSRTAKRMFLRSTVSLLALLALSFGFTVLLLAVLPGAYPFNTVVNTVNDANWAGNIASLFSPLYSGNPLAPGVWLDGLVVADVVMEVALIVVASLVGLKWAPLSSERELRRLAQIGASEEACLVLLVSAGTCLKTRGKDKLVATVQNALTELKLGAVFVVDMGSGNAPLDDTWKIVASVDPVAAHYVYLPDRNRRLAEFWISQIWVPFLHKSGRIGRLFKQMLVVDLDAVPAGGLSGLSLGALNKLLMVADGNIDDNSGTSVLLPVASDLPGWTGSWESTRLKAEYYRRMMESGFTNGLVTSVTPSESVNIVDRRTMQVAASADPTQTALAAAKRRGKVLVSAQSGVERLTVQNTIYQYYANQAAVIPNAISQMGELLFAPKSLVHLPSLGLKFFLLVGPLLELGTVMLRPLIFGTLLFRDPICLGALLVCLWALSVVTGTVHEFNQWRAGRSKDLDAKVIAGTVLTYPFYQLYLGALRLGLVVGGATYGRLRDDAERPSAGSSKELYPCLPHADVDWFTCWKTSDATRLSVLSSAAVDTSRFSNEGSEAMV